MIKVTQKKQKEKRINKKIKRRNQEMIRIKTKRKKQFKKMQKI